jgi:hypothetical protein
MSDLPPTGPRPQRPSRRFVRGCAARGVPPDPCPALLGAQGGQRDQRPADLGTADGTTDAGRDPRRRRPRPRRARRRRIRSPLRRQVGPRRSPRSSTTSNRCSPSTTSPPSTGSTSRRPTPIESTFSTVRLRTKVTKGPGSKAAGPAMAFKLIESAQQRWRAVNGPHLVALVRAGARFDEGVIVERQQQDQEDPA